MIWFIHRNLDGSIASAHQDHMPGYNDEQLDDAKNAEMQAYRALVTAAPKPRLTVDDLAAKLVDKKVLEAADVSVDAQQEELK